MSTVSTLAPSPSDQSHLVVCPSSADCRETSRVRVAAPPPAPHAARPGAQSAPRAAARADGGRPRPDAPGRRARPARGRRAPPASGRRAPASTQATGRPADPARRLFGAEDDGARGGEPAAGAVHAGELGVGNLAGAALAPELLDGLDQEEDARACRAGRRRGRRRRCWSAARRRRGACRPPRRRRPRPSCRSRGLPG